MHLPPLCPVTLEIRRRSVAPLRWVDIYPPLSRARLGHNVPKSAVLLPERFRAELAPSAFRLSRTLSEQTYAASGAIIPVS
jgi:hypothetical protein